MEMTDVKFSTTNLGSSSALMPKDGISISALIDGEPFGRFQKRVIALCFLLMTLDTFDLSLIAFAAPGIAGALHVPIAKFGPVFAIGLVGNLVGAMGFGSAADRFGRRYPVIVGVAVFGLFTLLLPVAHTMAALLAIRFLGGLGLGGVLPNCIATSSEFSPARIRPGVVTAAACGLPLGSMLAGWIGFLMIPSFGWKSIFYVGGFIPLVLLPFLLFYLPESISFLALKRNNSPELARILGKIAPKKVSAEINRFTIAEAPASGSPVKALFTDGRMPSTVLIWILFLVGELLTFLLLNWLPALLQQSGIPLKRAIIIASVFSLGGIAGGFVLGIGSKRRDPRLLMGLGFVAAAIWIAALGLSIGHVAFVVLAVFLTGFFVTGSKVVMWAVSAAAYRTAMRSTGVGWASAFGRVGSILGPLTGGFLLGTGATVSVLFYFTALPAVVGAVGSFLLARKPQESLVIASMKTD